MDAGGGQAATPEERSAAMIGELYPMYCEQMRHDPYRGVSPGVDDLSLFFLHAIARKLPEGHHVRDTINTLLAARARLERIREVMEAKP